MSDPIDHVPTIEEFADDLAAVMDAAGFERATVFAVSTSTLIAAMFAARAPARVEGLVLWSPYTQGLRAVPDVTEIAGYEESLGRNMAAFEDLFTHHWGEGRTLAVYAPGLDTDRLRRSWGMLERASASPSTLPLLLQASLEADLEEVFKTIVAPSIVLTTEDSFQPEGIPRHVAELLPSCEFHVLPASTVASSLQEFFSPAIDHVERMVTQGRAARTSQRVLATVMFTDIVQSTELAGQLGDQSWRERLARHEHLLRDHIEGAGGRLISLTGDGSLSTFDGPARAIRCAVAFAADASELGLRVRAGLHTGECERVGEDLAGIAVHIGARVSALAGPGEVWVSRTVRDLVAGSGIEFNTRGEHAHKGVAGTWELFSVAVGTTTPVVVTPERPALRPTDRVLLGVAKHTPRALRGALRLSERRAR